MTEDYRYTVHTIGHPPALELIRIERQTDDDDEQTRRVRTQNDAQALFQLIRDHIATESETMLINLLVSNGRSPFTFDPRISRKEEGQRQLRRFMGMELTSSQIDAIDTPFQRGLRLLRACESARRWVGEKTLEEAWAACTESCWMEWLLEALPHAPGQLTWYDRGMTARQRVQFLYDSEQPGDYQLADAVLCAAYRADLPIEELALAFDAAVAQAKAAKAEREADDDADDADPDDGEDF